MRIKKWLFGSMLACSFQAAAIEDLKIKVDGDDAVLSWPSLGGEVFIIQHRADLAPATPWGTLSGHQTADSGTNRTTFIHADSVTYPPPSGGGGTGNFPSAPGSTQSSSMSTGSFALSDSALQAKIAELPEWQVTALINQSPDEPPLPWDPTAVLPPMPASQFGPKSQQFAQSSPGTSSAGASAATCGFSRVVRAGAHLINLPQGAMLSDIMLLPVEFGHTDGDFQTASLLVDGTSVEGTTVLRLPLPAEPTFEFDTTQLPNGTYDLQVVAAWSSSAAQSTPEDWHKVESDPVSITIYNEISFPDWLPMFGDISNSLRVSARSAHPAVAWFVDIYGEQQDYIGTMFGGTIEGKIEFVWNLVGPNNQLRTDEQFYFIVRTEWEGNGGLPGPVLNATDGSSSSVAPPKWKVTDPWQGPGDWVVANQQAFDFPQSELDFLDNMADSWVHPTGLTPLTFRPTPQTPNTSFRIHGNSHNKSGPNWTSFKEAVFHPESRNLYYFGHGGDDMIGHDPSQPNKLLSLFEVTYALRTAYPDRHRYRFVFLDGCETASGNFPQAFGYLKKDMTADDFFTNGTRPGAFVGWQEKKRIGAGSAVNRAIAPGGYKTLFRYGRGARFWKWHLGVLSLITMTSVLLMWAWPGCASTAIEISKCSNTMKCLESYAS